MLKVRADWLVKLRISSEQFERKWHPGLRPLQVKKSFKLIFCGVYYLTILVYTKTTIYLSVGG